MNKKLIRKFKDESASVYSIQDNSTDTSLLQYVISTRNTRDLMNYPEVVNIDFTEKMRNGITDALKALNHILPLSSIDSRTVNVFHILRGGLNFQVASALNKAYGYRWHSCSYMSSQRFLKEGKFEISEDLYRKFRVPDNSTVYTADIVASGMSLDNSLKYIDAFIDSKNYSIRNFVFFTIGCSEAVNVLNKWHEHFRRKHKDYDKTVLCFLEGQFALASENIEIANTLPDTDLLKSYKLGALISPEYEYSQFEKLINALEACVIYDGGKKGFEPINHIKDILEFWNKQLEYAEKENVSVWDEYNRRFPLDHYFEDIENLKEGSWEILADNKSSFWAELDTSEYKKLFLRFNWLWDKERIDLARRPGSLIHVCRKKIRYLISLLEK